MFRIAGSRYLCHLFEGSPHRAAAWHSSWFEDHPGQEFFLIRDLASECGSSVPRPVVTSLN